MPPRLRRKLLFPTVSFFFMAFENLRETQCNNRNKKKKIESHFAKAKERTWNFRMNHFLMYFYSIKLVRCFVINTIRSTFHDKNIHVKPYLKKEIIVSR